MSSELMRKTAAVLEAMAEHLDAEAAAEKRAADEQTSQVVADVQEKVASATGEDISPEVARKIAADPDIVETLTKLAEQQRGTTGDVEMGVASNMADNHTAVPRTRREEVKEAADQADERFVNWLTS